MLFPPECVRSYVPTLQAFMTWAQVTAETGVNVSLKLTQLPLCMAALTPLCSHLPSAPSLCTLCTTSPIRSLLQLASLRLCLCWPVGPLGTVISPAVRFFPLSWSVWRGT